MARWTQVTVSLFLVMMVAWLAACDSLVPPSNEQPVTPGADSGIWVTGTGRVFAVPDLATLNVGIEAEAATVAEAMEAAAIAAADVSTALLGAGVEGSDIQTSQFGVSQRTRRDDIKGQSVVTGYLVANTVTVKIRVLPVESYSLDYKVSRIIDAAARAGGGAVRINGISFTVEDPTSYYDEARKLAAADAETKADRLAEEFGVKRGKPTFVKESSPVSAPRSIAMGAAFDEEQSLPPISSGENEIVIYVQVAYTIE